MPRTRRFLSVARRVGRTRQDGASCTARPADGRFKRVPSVTQSLGGTGRSRRGLARRRTVSTSKALRGVPEPPVTTFWSDQYRSASDQRAIWLYITTCASGAQHAYAAVAEVPVKACSGCCVRPHEGLPKACLGIGLFRTTQPVNPGPLAMAVPAWLGFYTRATQK